VASSFVKLLTPVKILSYNKTKELDYLIFFGTELYMFRTVSLSIIRSLALHTQQYIQVMLTAC
jgi:hypothetical protein